MNKCLMIIGMHRSGTSLVSSVLQKAGLFIGDDLLGPKEDNPKGFYENSDFFNFHLSALYFLSLNMGGWSLQAVDNLNDELDQEAHEIVKKNSRKQWGWKDPRTTLFLRYWEKIIPEAKYLFIYRNPWDVADSLFRRGTDEVINENPVFALKSWDFYNREIIEMYKKHKEDSLLIHIDDIIKDIPSFIQRINQELGFTLNPQNAGEVFDESMFNSSDNLRSWQVSLVLPQVIDTLNELRNLTGKSKYEIDNIVGGVSMISDWYNFRSQQKNQIIIEDYQKEIELLNQENKELKAFVYDFESQKELKELLINSSLNDFENNDFQNAEKKLLNLCAIDKSSNNFYKLGIAQYNLGKYKSAIESLTKSISTEQPDKEKMLYLARCLEKIGDNETAGIFLKRISN